MGYEAYQKIKGTKQGQFKGETTRVGWDQHAPILSIDYAVLAPRDASTGKAKGKRHHKPVVVLKEWGPSSPQLFSAVTSNELLSEVNFFFVEKDDNGKDRVYYTITLTDAHIISIRKFSGSPNAGDPATAPNAKNPTDFGTKELEEIAYSFKKIKVSHEVAKTMATDDWDAAEST